MKEGDKTKRPEIVVFAGPNGSGKSTFTALLKPCIDYINADEIKKNLKCSDLEAMRLVCILFSSHLFTAPIMAFAPRRTAPRNRRRVLAPLRLKTPFSATQH